MSVGGQGKGLSLVFAIGVLSLLLIGSTVCEVDPDDEEFAMEYLKHYHYVPPTNTTNQNVTFAIENFQRFFGLSATGELDDKTLEVMNKPRCGDPDVDIEGVRVKRYALRGYWNKRNLTYYLAYGKDLPAKDQARIIARAFKYWSDICPTLKFTRTKDSLNTDIRISFGRRRHNGIPREGRCPIPFDGKGRVIAHAFFPIQNLRWRGRIHFDEDEYFTENGGYVGWFWSKTRTIGLLYTAVHEIGHSLGLMHSNVRGSVMWPLARSGRPRMHQDDINGINALYGAKSTTAAPTTQD